MTILNMVTKGSGGGGNIGEPLNLTVTASGRDATITWEDNEIGTIPPTTFARSVLVRKIGSAPTSPSDGTTVVTETVKDTYKVSGYVDSGLTGGTTYYYRVFSYSDLGGISYCDAESVTISTGWQPGANTVAYYPLETDTNDASGNNRHLSNGTQPSFATGDLKYAYSTGSARCWGSAFTFPLSEFTISYWVKITNLNQSGKFQFMVRTEPGGANAFAGLYGTNYTPNLNIFTWTITSGGDMAGTTPTVDTWYHFCYTFKSGTTSIVYVNGNSVGGGTAATKTDETMILYLFGSNTGDNCKMGMSEFILENKVRTSTEVGNYFNLTKGDYLIS